MGIKKQKEAVSLAILLMVTLIGFGLIYWFYIAVFQVGANKENAPATAKLNDTILNEVTAPNTSQPLLLQDNDFGRENPFNEIK